MAEVKDGGGKQATTVMKCSACASGNTKGCLFQNEEHGVGNRVFNKTQKAPKSTGHTVWRCTACGELREV